MADAITLATAPERWLERRPDAAVPPYYRGLWRIGKSGLMATDGSIVIIERVDADRVRTERRWPKVSPIGWLNSLAPPVGVWPIEVLREWAGPVDWIEPSPKTAEGEQIHRPVACGGISVDLCMVARALDVMPDGVPIAVHIIPIAKKAENVHAVLLKGVRTHAIVGGLRDIPARPKAPVP